MNQTPTFHEIAQQLNKYESYLLSAAWFQTKPESTKEEWLEPLEVAKRAIQAEDAVTLWEAAIDHMFAAEVEHDTGPEQWQILYQMIDDLRTELGVDSTNPCPEPC